MQNLKWFFAQIKLLIKENIPKHQLPRDILG
jgi:hypothetical protein